MNTMPFQKYKSNDSYLDLCYLLPIIYEGLQHYEENHTGYVFCYKNVFCALL